MKKVIGIVLTLCMVISMLPTAYAAEAKFEDVPTNEWCYDYVDYVDKKGYFGGTTATTFEPNEAFTRQQFVVVLARMAGVTVDNSQSAFIDVPVGSYSAGAIAWAAKNGIAGGRADGTFGPTEPVTRQQMCAFMVRFMDYYSKANGVTFKKTNKQITFIDENEIADYAQDAVDQCVNYGLIGGYADKSFRPTAYATRAHGAAIIQRLDKATVSGGGSSGGSSGGGDTGNETVVTKYKIIYKGENGVVLHNTDKVEKNKSYNIQKTWTDLVQNDMDFDNNGVDDKFLGWKIEGTSEVITKINAVTADTTLVPVWDLGFKVTYFNGQPDTEKYNQTWDYTKYASAGEVSVEAALTGNSDYYFQKWTPDAARGAAVTISSGKFTITDEVITKGVFLVAGWGDVDKYEVSFENLPVGVTMNPVKLTKGTAYTFESLADADADGNNVTDKFVGWKVKDSSGPVYLENETKTFDEDTVLVPVWTLRFPVSFENLPAGVVMADEILDQGAEYTMVRLDDADMDGNGYADRFRGWKVQGGDGTLYEENDKLTINAATTLVPVWAMCYSVTYQEEDGTVIPNPDTSAQADLYYYYDAAPEVTVRAMDDTSFKFFKGWKNVADSLVYHKDTNPTFLISEDVVLQATWGDKDDYLLKALAQSIGLFNGPDVYGRYTNAQGVLQIGSVTVDPLTTVDENDVDTFESDTGRTVYASASAQLRNDTVESLVKTAINYAEALVIDKSVTVEGTVEDKMVTVKAVVEALGLTWTDGEIRQVAEALKTEAKSEARTAAYKAWDYFQVDGDYIFDTANVIVGGKTIFSISAEGKCTNLGATASTKALAEAIAKDMFAQLKQYDSEANATTAVALNTAVTLDFVGANPSYTTEYTLDVTLNLSNDLVSFWYDADEDVSHLILTIPQSLQNVYDTALYNDLVATGVEALKGKLTPKMEGTLTGFIDNNESLLQQLVDFGVYADMDAAKAAVKAVAQTAANNWVEANISTASGTAFDFFWNGGTIEIVGDTYKMYDEFGVEIVGGSLFNNDGLTTELQTWANGLLTDELIVKVMSDAMDEMLLAESSDPNYDTIKAEYQALIADQATGQLNSGLGRYFADALTNVNVYAGGVVVGTENVFEKMFSYTYQDALGNDAVKTVSNVDALLTLTDAETVASFNHALTFDPTTTSNPSVVELVQGILVTAVEDKVGGVYSSMIASLDEGLIKDILNSGASVELYVKNMAMIKMGLTDYVLDEVKAVDGTKTPAENLASTKALAVSTIKTYINTNVLNPFINSVPGTIDGMVADLAGPYVDFLNMIGKVSTFDKLADLPMSDIAGIITGDSVNGLLDAEKIADKISGEKMTKALKALAYAIEKLPAKASITVDGTLLLSETGLADLKGAAETGEVKTVLSEVAVLLNKIGSLKLNAFDVPVEVVYGERTFKCKLHIEIV